MWKNLKDVKQDLERDIDVQLKSIDAYADKVIKKVNEEKERLKALFVEKERPTISIIEQEVGRLNKHVKESIVALETITNLVEKTTSNALVVKHDALELEVTSLLDKHASGQVNKDMAIGMYQYVPDDTFDIKDMLGSIVPMPKKRECRIANEFGTFQQAAFLTVTSTGLFYVTDIENEKDKLYIFKEEEKDQKIKKLKSIRLTSRNKSKKAQQVAISKGGDIYVARLTHVEVYHASGRYDRVFFAGRQKATDNIKIMNDGKLLLGDRLNQRIFILSPEEDILQTISTDIEPYRVALMPNGHVAISNEMLSKVLIINIESGNVARKFAATYAHALCYHEESDCLFVAGCSKVSEDCDLQPNTGVIEQYCATTGRYVGRLVTNLYAPRDMCFTPSGYLAVADFKTVKLYEVHLVEQK